MCFHYNAIPCSSLFGRRVSRVPPGFCWGRACFLIARLAALFHVPLGALLGCPKGPPTFGRAITLDRLDDASHRFVTIDGYYTTCLEMQKYFKMEQLPHIRLLKTFKPLALKLDVFGTTSSLPEVLQLHRSLPLLQCRR